MCVYTYIYIHTYFLPRQRLDPPDRPDGDLRGHDLGVHIRAPDAPDVGEAVYVYLLYIYILYIYMMGG